MTEAETTLTDPNPTDTKNRVGLKGKLMALAFVLIVVLAECLVARLLFPSADDTAAMAQALLAPAPAASALPPVPASVSEEDQEKEQREVDLGQYDVSSYQPLANTTLMISVHLYGTVRTEDHDEMTGQLEAKRQRIRENVLVILRSAELTDLSDAGLGLIKRKILEKTNRALGKPFLQQVIFSEFSFLEQ